MKIDVRLDRPLTDTVAEAIAAESAGFDALWFAEAGTDPFVPNAVAAPVTSTLGLGTAIAVAFGRSPLTVAQIAWDLNALSRGRFMLGLGSQVKAHIERRYSMPWSRPAARMREYLLAVDAIWSTWETGAPLDFNGDFYSHTLMTPTFSPSVREWGRPEVHLAAVGPLMTEVAGEVADGVRVHSFTTARYLSERTIPSLQRGLSRAGRQRSDVVVSLPLLVGVVSDESDLTRIAEENRRRVSFYGSTPAYREVLELHGWGELQTELHALSLQQRWDDMAACVDDEVLNTFAVIGEPSSVAEEIQRRYAGLVDRVCLYFAQGLQEGPAAADLLDALSKYRDAYTTVGGRQESLERK
ncbi:TIGR03617 family F420-dependent LLM class oxidoreductase [Acidimicrobiia bacterium EGI L10123]|uniref:TIGR03617 family F420-dependent LLM class oxidoreductase n=1 Tax=Salinilacustrithrix flava TaxID=2957203 RepID=UPI003D7C3345|nr:TIGR03617 family F420-dependent LLM class oxidoreductase [Acidimicrobiia bacterium EGI L10123]